MPRPPSPRAQANATAAHMAKLLFKAATTSLEDTGEVVAMLETMRRTAPRDYIAAMVMIAHLGAEIPEHNAKGFTVISAIPRSPLDTVPDHLAPDAPGTSLTTVN